MAIKSPCIIPRELAIYKSLVSGELQVEKMRVEEEKKGEMLTS